VAQAILAAAQASGKPVIVNFLGSNHIGRENELVFTSTLEETARAALRQVKGASFFEMDPDRLDQLAAPERQKLAPGQRYLRGLFSGGSLCDEAMAILTDKLGGIYSNIPLSPEWKLADAWQSQAHSCLDMGEEEFTLGRPHPMIDLRLRQERILKEASDPTVAVILLDVVIGYGAHPNPAEALVESIGVARATAAGQGRYLPVVAHVCGADRDPQGLQRQESRLREAGVIVLPTNAQAARVAAAIVS
jgi:hypothetical protein